MEEEEFPSLQFAVCSLRLIKLSLITWSSKWIKNMSLHRDIVCEGGYTVFLLWALIQVII